MTRDPYAALPTVGTFELNSHDVADGETLPVPQRSGISGWRSGHLRPQLEWVGFPTGDP